MIRRRIIYLLALIGSLIFYLCYQEWFAWVLLQVVVFFPLLALLLSIPAMVRLRMELDLPDKVSMGHSEKMQLNVSSKLPLPPHKCKIRVTKPMTGESWKLKPGAALPTEHCGKLHIELLRPSVFDYLGIFRLKVKTTTRKTLLVLPEPVEVVIPPNLFKQLEPCWKRKPGGGFAENYEIRQYHPGDSMNQIHWKLSAKVGELMLREPMEPERGVMLLTMDLNGTATELDQKLGQFLWLGQWLTEREISFDVRVLTGNGIVNWTIRNSEDLDRCILTLLDTPLAREGSIRGNSYKATWRYHIGGEQSEK